MTTEYWLDYESIFDDLNKSKDSLSEPVSMPVKIDDLEFRKLYETPVGHKWSSWVQAYQTPSGALDVLFRVIEGGPTDLAPDYGWHFIGPKALDESGIRRMDRHLESKDGGHTWDPVAQYDASDLSIPGMLPTLYLDDGTLLGVGGEWCPWPDPRDDREGGGSIMTALSHDDGATWEDWNTLNDSKREMLVWGRVKLLRDGTLVLPAYGTLASREQTATVPWDACLFFSCDSGKSWSEPLVLAMGTPTLSMEEPDVTELGNGDLLVIMRHTDPSQVGTLGVYANCGQMIVRRVDGKWVAGPLMKTPMTFRGMPATFRTRDGVLICAGSGNQFNFSVDDGRSWSSTQTIADPAYNRHNHYPVLKEMPDGRVLSFYHFGNDWPYPSPEDQWIHMTSFRVSKV